LLDEISRILAWRLAARNNLRFANAALTTATTTPWSTAILIAS